MRDEFAVEAPFLYQVRRAVLRRGTIVRAHQHAAGARTDPPPDPGSKGAAGLEHQVETPWQSLVARLAEVVLEARAWAARAAGSPASST
ncbi:hypothetical protein [Streptomyces malaysiensis]|uniref:hypothetical protein n=1 Tax=Streptomyces malaysiensis TaxID=92644 RepID=UPI00142EB188|nr:hypothetical protein [Streptomyces malaysiensis]